MDITIHTYHHPDQATAAQLDRIENALGIIKDNQEELMATIEDLETVLADTDVKVSAIKTDFAKLLALLAAVPPAGMSAEQQAAFDAAVAHAKTINDSLAAVDASANPPTA